MLQPKSARSSSQSQSLPSCNSLSHAVAAPRLTGSRTATAALAGPAPSAGRAPVDHHELANALVDYDSDAGVPALRVLPGVIDHGDNAYRENSEAGISLAGTGDSVLAQLDGMLPAVNRIANYMLAGPLPQRRAARLASLGSRALRTSIAALTRKREEAVKRLSAAVYAMRDDQKRIVPAARDAAIAAFKDITAGVDEEGSTATAFFRRSIDAWIADGVLSSNAVLMLSDFLRFNRIPCEEMDAMLRLAAIKYDTHSDAENGHEGEEEDDEYEYFEVVGHSNWPEGYRHVLDDRSPFTFASIGWFDCLFNPGEKRNRQDSRLKHWIWRNIVAREHDDAWTSERLVELDNTALPSHFGRALSKEWFETVLFDPVIAPYASSLMAIAERLLPDAYDFHENVPFEWVRAGKRTLQFLANLLQHAAGLAKVTGIAPMRVDTRDYLPMSPLFDKLLLDDTISEPRAQQFLTHFSVITAALEESDVEVKAQCIHLLLSAQWSDDTVSRLLAGLVSIGKTSVLANVAKLRGTLGAIDNNPTWVFDRPGNT